ncbi:MAG: inorganic phosphate transporter [Candidatus Heimdallarchaeota archaeon]
MVETIFIVIVIISVLLAFAIGANDETFASVVGVKRLSVRTAVLFGAAIALIGGIFLSKNVGETLREDISSLDMSSNLVLISIYVAMAVSLILASFFGLPISSTEAMVGAIIGISIATGSKIHWDWNGMGHVLATWFISPALGFSISFGVMKLINFVLKRSIKSFRGTERANTAFGYLLLAMVVLTGLSRAGNDINNAIAPIVPFFTQNPDGAWLYQKLPFILGGLGLGAGLIIIGWRVLKTLGNDVVELTPESAFVTEGVAAFIVFIAVFLGIPVSGTLTLVSCFLGAGVGMKKAINYKTLRMIVIFIFLTPLISGLCAVGCYFALRGVVLT